MNNIQKASSYLSLFLKFLIIFLPIYTVIQWIFIHVDLHTNPLLGFFGCIQNSVETPEGLVTLSRVQWNSLLKFMGFSADLLGKLPFLISLYYLIQIFQNYKTNKIFTYQNAQLYRKLGFIYLIDALIIKSLSNTLLVFAVTMTNPPGHRYISVSFGTPNLASLFYGSLVIIISWVMLEAFKMQEEQELIV